jgi:23S rRNA pseudouridine2605 synthase
VASRREAEKLISAGRVSVNGRVIMELGAKADPDSTTIAVDGKPVDLRPKTIYVLLNKPKGYTSTRRDPHAARVVVDLVKGIEAPLYPVGRLDVDTEGLIILTNDGDFSFKMTHPKHNIPKTYRAEVRGKVTQEELRRLSTGIMLNDGITAPARAILSALNTVRQVSIVEITIREGRKRQVRRMMDAINHSVIKLTRTRFGNLSIGRLKSGEWRFLTQKEVHSLLDMASKTK